MKRFLPLALGLGALFILACQPSPPPSPNIVYILADDMGYGDISALNPNGKLNTPHLDALVAGGMSFSDAHSGSAVCTPTRYGILTGRYAWRSSLKQGVSWSWSEPLIPARRTTVASLLKRQGYTSACVGKWHLGLGWQKDSSGTVDIRQPLQGGPNALGFDYFFGITASLDIPPYIYIENDRSTTQQIDTIEGRSGKEFWRPGPIGDDFTHEGVLPKLTEKAVGFINDQATADKPFFLYFPLPAPHTPILPTKDFQGKSGTNEYGDFVLMVDDVVGQIQAALEAKGLRNNTLLVFTSDNGCSPMADFAELAQFDHDPSYVYRGHKADIFEGGHRVPFIAQWPGQIPAGSRSDEPICLTDLLATCAALVGEKLTDTEGEDSYNLLPVLQGEVFPEPLREATVHHSINGSFAIRQGKWKLALCPGSGGWSEPVPKVAKAGDYFPVQLYDLETDIGEETNLAAQHPEVVARLTTLMERYIAEGRSTPGAAQQNEGETRLFVP